LKLLILQKYKLTDMYQSIYNYLVLENLLQFMIFILRGKIKGVEMDKKSTLST